MEEPTVRTAIQRMQESYYHDDVDYRAGSPHLAHRSLHERLVAVLREHVRRLDRDGLPLSVLEIGAGHGGFTEPALAAGCSVTAVEMSRPSLRRLDQRFGINTRFRGVFDPDGSLSGVGGDFSLVLCVSVLHHIPDYVSFVDGLVGRLAPGGSFLALQDPLWYPRAGKATRLLDRGGYYVWRLGQGDLSRGLATLSRRARGAYDDTNPADMVEYHVVRQGVDEAALLGRLRPYFAAVELLPYWSNQLAAGQWLGERLGLRNMFGVSAVARS
jgi:2-polyprenyl-3-methyl-5-hydroxy-6-metoxy-1,4-benzoquinol methylase